jgi:hypothetical protein
MTCFNSVAEEKCYYAYNEKISSLGIGSAYVGLKASVHACSKNGVL